jgi:6-methylsalicylate decarboxylase
LCKPPFPIQVGDALCHPKSPAAIAFLTNTSQVNRTVLNKDINWIWSHGGGALTAFADRFLVQAISRPPYAGKVTRATVDGELKRFYYDTAQVANNVTLAAMAQLMPISQIVYGTDFPYRTAADDTKGVTEFFKGDDLKAVDRENVIRLIPRLKAI